VLQTTLDVDGNSQRFDENQLEFRYESSGMKNSRFIFSGKFGQQIDTDNYRLGDIIELNTTATFGVDFQNNIC
jgi:hypothetical protein